MDRCVFCPIAAGEVDADLVILRTGQVFAIPALRQRPHNREHVLLLPVAHIRNLEDAPPAIRDEVFAVTAQLTAAAVTLPDASGSIVFQNNVRPDDPYFHLHVHVVPRFPGDQFTMHPAVAEVSRPDRLQQAAVMRRALP